MVGQLVLGLLALGCALLSPHLFGLSFRLPATVADLYFLACAGGMLYNSTGFRIRFPGVAMSGSSTRAADRACCPWEPPVVHEVRSAEEREQLLRELIRVLKPGGRLAP